MESMYLLLESNDFSMQVFINNLNYLRLMGDMYLLQEGNDFSMQVFIKKKTAWIYFCLTLIQFAQCNKTCSIVLMQVIAGNTCRRFLRDSFPPEKVKE